MNFLQKTIETSKVFTITIQNLKLAQKKNANIVELKKKWAFELIKLFKIKVKIIGNIELDSKSMIFVGNHLSYLDIPLLIYNVPELTFVSKKEVARWPILGFAAKKMGTIFVDRSNANSKKNVKEEISKILKKTNQKIIIFPSGTTNINPSKMWKRGAFELAHKNNLKILPFKIKYTPLRECAYIDDDNLITHMFKLFTFKKIMATIEFLPPINITNIDDDCKTLQEWCEKL